MIHGFQMTGALIKQNFDCFRHDKITAGDDKHQQEAPAVGRNKTKNILPKRAVRYANSREAGNNTKHR